MKPGDLLVFSTETRGLVPVYNNDYQWIDVADVASVMFVCNEKDGVMSCVITLLTGKLMAGGLDLDYFEPT